jgi:hypothetical protein
MTVNSWAYVTVARPDIATGWPERQPNQRYMLQTVSGEVLPILKEVSLPLNQGRRPVKILVFITNITNEFILGLDILRAYDASRAPKAASRYEAPGGGSRPSSLVVAKDKVIPAQCEGILMARLESPLGV